MRTLPEPSPQVAALLLDWDGTLVDSQKLNYLSLRDALRQFGGDLDEEWYSARTGIAAGPMVDLLVTEHHQQLSGSTAEVVAQKEVNYAAIRESVGLHADVARLAQEFRGRLPIAVASGSSREAIAPVLAHLQLEDWFDTVVCADDVPPGRTKPEPDIFLEAARRLQVAPAHCLVYEDSDQGLQAAQQAGMQAVDVRQYR